MAQGKFIVLEGINGCGKGTQLPYLVDLIHGADKSSTVFVTREPNDFDNNGRKAREMLGADGDPYENALEAVKYFAENRKAHNEIFVPMLEKGINVISDRYWHSNFAFQGAQGVPYSEILLANEGSWIPDLTLILDVSVEVAFERLAGRDGEKRRKFDSNKDFLANVAANYQEISFLSPLWLKGENVYLIDGNRPIEAVQKRIKFAYDSVFKDA